MSTVWNPHWSWLTPLLGWLALAGSGLGGGYPLVLAAALAGSVIASVHPAEVVAHHVGEPFGTLVLALAVTLIEVSLIVSLMIAGGPAANELARDTIFAAIMLILGGIVGACLLIGGLRHREQSFDTRGVSSSLAVLAALSVLTLVLPNYTTSTPGPSYNIAQLISVAFVSLALYALFVFVQTLRHRDYFLPDGNAAGNHDAHAALPSAGAA